MTTTKIGWFGFALMGAVLIASFAVGCDYEVDAEPTRAPTIRSTPTPTPTASPDDFEERVAAGKLWFYDEEEHLRSGAIERSLVTTRSLAYQGFRSPPHGVRLTVKCNHEGEPLVGVIGMGFIADARIAVFFRADGDVQEQLTEFVKREDGFIYQPAFVEGETSPFYRALLTAREMTVTTHDYAGAEMTAKWQYLGGLPLRIGELGCFPDARE